MKTKLLFLFLFFALQLSAQKIIDRRIGTETVNDSVVVLIDTVFNESGIEGVQEYTVTRKAVGDTSKAVSVLSGYVTTLMGDGLSGMKNASNWRAAIAAFGQIQTTFQSLADSSFVKHLAGQYGGSIAGSYTVRLDNATTFQAVIERTNAGTMRLRRTSDNTTWGVIALPQNSFRVQNFDPGSGADFWLMLSIDPGERPLYRPEVWYVGKGSSFAMRKN